MRKLNRLATRILMTICFSLSLSAVANSENKDTKIVSQAVSPAAKNLAKLVAKITSFKADFEQKVVNEIGETMDLSKGDFAIQRPNHFRWNITEEFAQLIVADGDHMWTYDKDLEQVTIQNQSQLLANSPLLLLTANAEELAEAYKITQVELEDKPDDSLFLLLPKSEQSVFESVHILFKQGVLAEFLIADTLGQKTTVAFAKAELNAKLEPSLFSFEMPEGIDLVDSRQQVNTASE